MIRIILAALRAHPAQALTIGLLAAVAAGLSAILPTYLVGAVDAGTQATVDAAPLSQRLITVTAVVPARSAVADAERRTADARRALERPGIHLVTGMRAAAQLTKAGTNESFAAVLAHREDVCAHLRITGSCPAGDHDALVSARDADRLACRPATNCGTPTATAWSACSPSPACTRPPTCATRTGPAARWCAPTRSS